MFGVGFFSFFSLHKEREKKEGTTIALLFLTRCGLACQVDIAELAKKPELGYQSDMTLDQYLRKTHTTSREFAGAVKVSLFAVIKWRQGVRIPRSASIRRIEKQTGGKVKPKDWYR